MATKFKTRLVVRYLDDLQRDGERILRECEAEKTYEHDTHNLYDSYGYGVYYNNRLMRRGYLSASPQATEAKEYDGREIKGREEIDEFLESRKPNAKGLALVIAAVMPYGADLEEGRGVTRKFRVISMSFDKLRKIVPYYYTSRVQPIDESALW